MRCQTFKSTVKSFRSGHPYWAPALKRVPIPLPLREERWSLVIGCHTKDLISVARHRCSRRPRSPLSIDFGPSVVR